MGCVRLGRGMCTCMWMCVGEGCVMCLGVQWVGESCVCECAGVDMELCV